MKTVIFCGGLGTRMPEETEFRPKPMVPVGVKPILWHIMKIYSCFGNTDFILPLGYKGEMIKEYFWNFHVLNSDVTLELGSRESAIVHNSCSESGWKVTLVDTGQETLKGERLKMVQNYIDGDRFFCTYGDGVADIDLNALLAFHKSHGKLATLTGVRRMSSFGELRVEDGRVVTFQEKPENDEHVLTSAGFFVFEREVLERLTLGQGYDLETGLLADLVKDEQLHVYKHPGQWAWMDTLRDVQRVNELWNSGKAPWKMWDC